MRFGSALPKLPRHEVFVPITCLLSGKFVWRLTNENSNNPEETWPQGMETQASDVVAHWSLANCMDEETTMNLFFLNECPKQAALDLADVHVGKMLLEACQMMSTAARQHGFDGGYARAYEHHPMTKWVARSKQHYEWAWGHALSCAGEHEVRFGTYHKSALLLPTLSVAMHTVMPDRGWRNPPRCMPDDYKVDFDAWDGSVPCHVQSYRDYYADAKRHLHKWTNVEAPEWLSA
jgi:hypothetical protein